MRKILAACGLLLLAMLQPASAQSLNLIKVPTCGTGNFNVPYLTVDATGTLCTQSGSSGDPSDANISQINGAPVSATNPIWVAPASNTAFPVVAAPRSAMTVAGCTVGAASAQCLAASTANFWIQVQNTHATNQVACSWGGTAALNAAGSFMLAPGQSASWGVMSGGVPTNALNCIASGAATPLYVEYR